MTGGIFLLGADDQLIEMRDQPYESEDILQALIARFPSLLAGDQFASGEARRWLLVRREVGLPTEEYGSDRLSLDHLFLDQDAVPTLVEVKRSSDTRIRREIVGQMLDYAANAVVYYPVEQLREAFEHRCRTDGLDPDGELGTALGPDINSDSFWELAGTNLRAGRVRLVFLADRIPPELARIVEFLNGQMSPAEVIAIEIRQYVGEGLRTLVPRVIGQTAEAAAKKPGRDTRLWDEQSFLAEIEAQRGLEETRIARELLAWARRRTTRVTWGSGTRSGSFIPVIDVGTVAHYPFAAYTGGGLYIYFQWLTKPPFDRAVVKRELLDRLNAIPGVDLPSDVLTRRPMIPMSLLAGNPAAMTTLILVLDWLVDVSHTGGDMKPS